MQSKHWKSLLFAILLAPHGVSLFGINVDEVWAVNSYTFRYQEPNNTLQSSSPVDLKNYCEDNFCQKPEVLRLLISQTLPEPQPNPTVNNSSNNAQRQSNPPQLEGQPSNLPKPASEPIQQLLNKPQTDYSQRLERLIQLLRREKPPTDESGSDDNLELGLRVRPRPLPEQPIEQIPTPPLEQPVDQFKPIGYLQGRVGYFTTNNIFSSNVDVIKDGLIFYGLTLASTYLPLGPKTYINGSIDGFQIRYFDQSIYDYNQLRFNLSLYQRLSQRMYGEIAFSNQQLFYANNGDFYAAGDRFLNENSLRLSLGRRDPLNSKLTLDSFYELSFNFADPESRNRIINSFWLSLSYSLQEKLQVGINYQLNLSNFTQRPDARADAFHRLFGQLSYRISNYSNINVQSGVSFGGSTVPTIDFDSLFFSLNYSLDLGRF
jgi:hypothetical protein